jgi:SAM-dependent methyltransferase
MSQADKDRWNGKYLDNPPQLMPIGLVSDNAKLAIGKQALDIACGMGRHSRYLASQGFAVDALDISIVAIDALQGEQNINAIEVDFDTYELQKDRYNLIVCTYFLERRLFPQMIDALKAGGIIIFQTFLHDNANDRQPSNSNFMLNSGELEEYFENRCELLHISEFWDIDNTKAKMKKVAMVAKKRNGGMSLDEFWA